mgnify:CR=1 FL=1
MGYTGLPDSKGESKYLRIFPNPADQILTLEALDNTPETLTYAIYSSLGQMIREEKLSFEGANATVKLNDLANGLYIISIRTGKGSTLNERFTVKH